MSPVIGQTDYMVIQIYCHPSATIASDASFYLLSPPFLTQPHRQVQSLSSYQVPSNVFILWLLFISSALTMTLGNFTYWKNAPLTQGHILPKWDSRLFRFFVVVVEF